MIYGVLLNAQTRDLTSSPAPGTLTDADLYRLIVERMKAGQGYYEADGGQLREMGFATRPFFNWRLPTLAEFLWLLPSVEAGRWVLAGLACVAFLMWIGVLEKEGPRWMRIAGGILLFCPLGITAITPSHNFHEAWAGVCIALSLAMWGQGCRRTSVAFGVLAVFLRELALPYLVVMLAMAAWERRRGEALAWLGGIVAFGIFLAIHAWVVGHHMNGADKAHEGWLQCGGWPFVVRTARCNPALLLAPPWTVGITLPLALLGLLAWTSPVGVRAGLTVGMYVAAFLLVGRSVNTYWGLLYAPLLPLGWLYAPAALKGLLGAALPSRLATNMP